MGVGRTFAEAFLKAQLGAGERIQGAGKIALSVRDADKPALVTVAKNFLEEGYSLIATAGTASFLQNAGVPVTAVNKVQEGGDHIVDLIKSGAITMVINTTTSDAQSVADSHAIRRSAVNLRIPLYTTIAGVMAISEGVKNLDNRDVHSIQGLHQQL